MEMKYILESYSTNKTDGVPTISTCHLSVSQLPSAKICFRLYRVSFFLTGAPLKVLSVRLHSKFHQKSS